MMGLAVGIDYVLFIVSRYREERTAGFEKLDAIERAGSTASRAVLFSRHHGRRGAGRAADRADDDLPEPRRRRDPGGAVRARSGADAAAREPQPARRQDRCGPRVAARPGAPARALGRRSASGRAQSPASCAGRSSSIVVVTGALIVAAIPVPRPQHGRRGRHEPALDAAVPAGLRDAPARLLGRARSHPPGSRSSGDPDSSANRAEIARITKAIADEPIFGTPSLEPGASARGAVLDVPINADANSPAATQAVRELRDLTDLPVGGTTSQNIDYFDISSSYLPIVVGIVLALSFLVLLLAFRSVVVPLLAIAMNLLSVGAAYGILTLVTQKGYGAGSARLPAGRHGRGLDPALPVLGALRPLDGLPRVPALADPRALRRDGRHGGGDRVRHHVERSPDHGRGPDHGRRVRRASPRDSS